jgi:hypothetical protein
MSTSRNAGGNATPKSMQGRMLLPGWKKDMDPSSVVTGGTRLTTPRSLSRLMTGHGSGKYLGRLVVAHLLCPDILCFSSTYLDHPYEAE